MRRNTDFLPEQISLVAETTLNKKLLILTILENGQKISRLPIPVKVWESDSLLSTLVVLVLSERKEGLQYNVYSPRKEVNNEPS